MARPNDPARAEMLKAKIAQVYGDPEDEDGGAVNAYPGGETRGREQRDIINAVPPAPGTPGRNRIEEMPQGSDSDVEDESQLEPQEGGQQSDMVQVPREIINKLMEQSGIDSLPVPRKMVDAVMQRMMGSASRNAVSRAGPADGAAPPMEGEG